ncbi:hypothetical protein WUBG_10755 [Wuchereria bancrofti]|uniref:Uncharacterized protein n=1 Tax=Wuchereria bancrofti TaxID=6293 RepID=J9E7P1_WUCBA|nr:hypothetical protein WUBG_10755 [Wuchereria bancrofti]
MEESTPDEKAVRKKISMQNLALNVALSWAQIDYLINTNPINW